MTTTTSNMSLQKPEVSVTSGTAWAAAINNSTELIDAHDHSTGKGVKISQTGIQFSDDFSFNDEGGTDIDFLGFTARTTDPTAAYVALYQKGNDLYVHTADGGNVQITSSGGFNSALVGGIGGDYTLSAASLDYDSVNEWYTFYKTLTKFSNVRVGAIQIHTDSEDPADEHGIKIQAPTSMAATYNWTLPGANPTVASFPVISSSGVWSLIGGASDAYKIIQLDSSGEPSVAGTGAVYLAQGTTAQRPGTPAEGMQRYNTDNSAPEFYDGSAWSTSGFKTDAAKAYKALHYNSSGVVENIGTDAIKISSGTTAQRPGSPAVSMIRYNTDLSSFEFYNGSEWVQNGFATSAGDAYSIVQRDASGVVVATNQTGAVLMPVGTTAQRPGAPSNGYMRYNTTISEFEGYVNGSWKTIPAYSAVGIALDDLVDVTNTTPSTGDVLSYNGAVYVNQANSLDNLTNTTITTPSDKQVLQYDNGTSKWVNVDFTLDGLTDTNLGTPTDQYVLTYDSGTSKWIPQAAPTTPANTATTGVTSFTSGSGTFTVPANVYQLDITLIGGGASGATTIYAEKQCTGGGAGGTVLLSVRVEPGDEIAYSVGAGGAAVQTQDTNGNAGGDTTCSLTGVFSLTANGGSAGNYNSGGAGTKITGCDVSGGSGSGGVILLGGSGQHFATPANSSGNYSFRSNGGNSTRGVGGSVKVLDASPGGGAHYIAGEDGSGYGSGGSGSWGNTFPTYKSGAGAGGLVEFRYTIDKV